MINRKQGLRIVCGANILIGQVLKVEGQKGRKSLNLAFLMRRL
jgi:hypothetical protein